MGIMGMIEILLLITIGSMLIIYVYEVVHGSIIRHFIIRNKKLTIEERIAKLEAVAITLNNLVTCESCGCAVLKDNAKKGKSEVETKTSGFFYFYEEEYIYTPYYCKGCYQDYLKTKKEKK